MQLVFKERLARAGDVTRFVFTPQQPLTWQPGQYLHYDIAHEAADSRGTERWFTISSAPFEKDVWITTRLAKQHGSSFKNQLLSLQPGQTIEADEPEGDFVVEDLSRNYIFVAGGIGITPFRSIISQLHHDGQDFTISLLYANRDATAIAFQDELEAISRQHKDFTITYFNGDKRIDEAVLREQGAKLEDPIYYVSGPEPMVEAFQATLEAMGVDEQHAKFDYFPGYEAE